MKCIYCLQDKPECSFTKTEHIIPQSFGVFRNNFTLNEVVCDECNKFFGDKLEIYLARDTFEGVSRFNLNIKESNQFKSLGKRSKLIIKVNEGPCSGSYAFLEFSPLDNKVILKPVPQIGFLNNNGEFKYFLLDEIPTIDFLEKEGFNIKISGSIVIFGCDLDRAKVLLAEKGINKFNFEGEKGFSEPNKDFLCIVKRVVDDVVVRPIAKIAFNYLAFWEGKDFVLDHSFDTIRNYIRFGIKPDYPFFLTVDDPILGDEPIEGLRRVGHLITVDWALDRTSIFAQVSLLNWMNYKVLLTRDFHRDKREITRGHFFNPINQEIFELVRG